MQKNNPFAMSRREDIDEFYKIMRRLEEKLGTKRVLSNCDGRMGWPSRGIYFFFEDGEARENGEPRVVRIGTHALKDNSNTSLWNRLSQHRGTLKGRHPGGGNHRGSVFRLHVGTAVIAKNGIDIPSWSVGSSAPSKDVTELEYPTEKLVSAYIGQMPFLWLGIDDPPGPDSLRGYIERNSIALLSNYGRTENIDPQSDSWLGNYARGKNAGKIHGSGLWNVNHVEERYDPGFIDVLKELVGGL